MSNNTITNTPNTLTPRLLREALDAWTVEQPAVIRKVADPNFDPGWEACVWSPVFDMQIGKKVATHHWECVGICLENGGAILFEAKDWAVLLWLAIEHQYRPWLQLVTDLDCTGAQAARMVLAGIEKKNSGTGVKS